MRGSRGGWVASSRTRARPSPRLAPVMITVVGEMDMSEVVYAMWFFLVDIIGGVGKV